MTDPTEIKVFVACPCYRGPVDQVGEQEFECQALELMKAEFTECFGPDHDNCPLPLLITKVSYD